MVPSSPRPLVVKLTVGEDSAEQCNAGLTVAAAATSAGAQVSLWLTGESVWLATIDRDAGVDLPHAAPLDGLLDLLLGSARVTVSAQCAARRGLDESSFVPGVRLAGAASYVEEILAPDAQAVVF
jgi:predicted peroxiredoxin